MTILQPQEIVNQRYQLERQLGQNAGRETWLAKDLQKENELVVVKLLAFGGNVQWEDLKLFEREANVLKQLNHPRIPKYRDYFSIDDRSLWFGLVQEYIQGDSLREYITKGHKFTESQVKKIAISILEILIYLHELSPQVLHRDIKPSNLILTKSEGETPNIYLVDFGAVQDRASAEGKSFTVVGTYGYAPMEQYGGRAVAASDLYALGATLIYLLTGISPADLPQDDEAKIIFRDRTSASPDFVEWIQTLVEPLLKKRYASAQMALEALVHPKPKRQSRVEQVVPSIQSVKVNTIRNYAPENTNIQVEKSEHYFQILIPNKMPSAILLLGMISLITLFFVTTFVPYLLITRLSPIVVVILLTIVGLILCKLLQLLTTSKFEINGQEVILSRYIFGKCYWRDQQTGNSSIYVEPNWIMMRNRYNNNLFGWLVWLSNEKNDDNSLNSNVKIHIQDETHLISANDLRPTEVMWLIEMINNFRNSR
ncbi:serine/threonine-protein kinase [Pseudanabaena sp. CCNP1317]|nr:MULTISPECIES: serine/threonine-protein kinase [Pseudanabaena]MEA5489513.1 serine/threonine-protein kinase [Pseudanabaena sp. CCNP1317]WGS71697.1 serine/threonine-protein kinase [Pseudanabaena galeata CCNP1313]